jgi:hypothetical protein
MEHFTMGMVWMTLAALGLIVVVGLVWDERELIARGVRAILPHTSDLLTTLMSPWRVPPDDDATNDDPAFWPDATIAATGVAPIAMPNSDRNALLARNDDDAVFAAKIEALVDALAAGQGKQTDLIKAIFKVNPSGTSERYKRIVEAVKAEQSRRVAHTTPIAQRPTTARF